MKPGGDPGEARLAIHLSMREWIVVAILSTLLVAVAPSIHFRPRTAVVEKDYRIPYALSSRYEIYRRFTAITSAQFPVILVGDSVVWGQCATRDQTLSHYLNEGTGQPRFANAGLDGMHPVALLELVQHHAPAIERKSVVLQFNPMWLMTADAPGSTSSGGDLGNHPGLVPRLAQGLSRSLKETVTKSALHLVQRSPLNGWMERFSDTRLDFLAWSLDHPYESPLRAISATLPPSEDLHGLRLTPWDRTDSVQTRAGWPDPLEEQVHWQAFERLLTLLELRANRVLVLVGPLNEHMMSPATLSGYQRLKKVVCGKLQARGIAFFDAPSLKSGNFGDICHPLGAGYEELARALLKDKSSWLLGAASPR